MEGKRTDFETITKRQNKAANHRTIRSEEETKMYSKKINKQIRKRSTNALFRFVIKRKTNGSNADCTFARLQFLIVMGRGVKSKVYLNIPHFFLLITVIIFYCSDSIWC